MIHDLGLALIAGGLASLVAWRLGFDAGHRDATDRIAAHLSKLRREQGGP